MPGRKEEDAEDKLIFLRDRLLSSVKKLRHTDLNMLQLEIIDRLINGRRTATELVMEIFEVGRGDADFQARYAAVRRELKDLETKGYISTRLFGRDKPYRLTRHGVAALCSIVPGTKRARILEAWRIVLFALTGVVGGILLIVRGRPPWLIFTAFGGFFFLLGLSVSAFVGILRKVI